MVHCSPCMYRPHYKPQIRHIYRGLNNVNMDLISEQCYDIVHTCTLFFFNIRNSIKNFRNLDPIIALLLAFQEHVTECSRKNILAVHNLFHLSCVLIYVLTTKEAR